MTSDGAEKEFHRQPRITLQMQITAEQAAAMKEWSASIPTLYFLDICVVNVTKLSNRAVEQGTRKAQLVQHLQDLDRPQHSFSYLFALMEKVSDSRGCVSDAELKQQILTDVAALRAFFKNARVIEPVEFLVTYLTELRRVPPEMKRPNYLKFLETANNRFKLHNPISPMRRFKKATEILQEADALSIVRSHPIVLITLACLYGNVSAKLLMKFKADAKKFNAENALADIMMIPRFAALKLEIEHLGHQGSARYMRSDFITDDDGLFGVFNCFDSKAVRHEPKENVYQTRIDVDVKLEELLADLGAERRNKPQEMQEQPKGEPDEYEQICKLLDQPSAEPS